MDGVTSLESYTSGGRNDTTTTPVAVYLRPQESAVVQRKISTQSGHSYAPGICFLIHRASSGNQHRNATCSNYRTRHLQGSRSLTSSGRMRLFVRMR